MTQPHIKLTGYLDVPAERWDAVMESLKTHIDLTRQEPGCISFNVEPCSDTPHRLLVSELFESQEDFDAHQVRAKASVWAEISAGIPRNYEIKEVSK